MHTFAAATLGWVLCLARRWRDHPPMRWFGLVCLILVACGPRTVEELDDAIGFSITRCSGPDCPRIDLPGADRSMLCTDAIAVDASGGVWVRDGCAGEGTLRAVGVTDEGTRQALHEAFERATSGAPTRISDGSCYESGGSTRSFERYLEDGSDGLVWNYCEGSEGAATLELEMRFESVPRL